MGFPRLESWNGLLWPPPRDLPGPGVEPEPLESPALVGRFFTTTPPGKLRHEVEWAALLCGAQPPQSRPTLCDPRDCSPPGSSVLGILQARTLQWAAVPSPRGSSWPRDWSPVSCGSCIAGRFFTTQPPRKPKWVNLYVKVSGCCLPAGHTASPI